MDRLATVSGDYDLDYFDKIKEDKWNKLSEFVKAIAICNNVF